MTVITSAFISLAQMRARHLGMPGHPTVVVAHPIASLKPDGVADLARAALAEVAAALTNGAPSGGA